MRILATLTRRGKFCQPRLKKVRALYEDVNGTEIFQRRFAKKESGSDSRRSLDHSILTHCNVATVSAHLSEFLQKMQPGRPRTQAQGFEEAHAQILAGLLWQKQVLSGATSIADTCLLVVVPSQKEAHIWAQVLAHAGISGNTPIAPRVRVLPELNVWGVERYNESNLVRNERLTALADLIGDATHTIYVASAAGLGLNTLTAKTLQRLTLPLKVGEEYDQDELIARLTGLGYVQTDMVDQEGVFAVRGGIVDIFAYNLRIPIRLEFFGDLLRSMREFQVDSQKSFSQLESLVIFPVFEADLSPGLRDTQTQKLYDYLVAQEIDKYDREGLVRAFGEGYHDQSLALFLPILRSEQEPTINLFIEKKIPVFVPHALDKVLQQYERNLQWFESEFDSDNLAKKPSVNPEAHYISIQGLETALNQLPGFELNSLAQSVVPVAINHAYENFPEALLALRRDKPEDYFEAYSTAIRKTLKDLECSIVLVAASVAQQEKVKSLLQLKRLQPQPATSLHEALTAGSKIPGQFLLCAGQIQQEAWFSGLKVICLPAQLLIGEKVRLQSQRQQRLKNLISSFRELKVGDCVVHKEHGVGRYLGMKTLPANGVDTDFLLIEYAGGDKLYLPVDKLGLLHKYSNNADKPVALDRLKGKDWEKKTTRIKKAIRDLSKELLQAEAQRRLALSVPFSEPGELYYRFEADFPFEETQDQVQAITDVNQDLTRSNPMDRLVCGDVGFGKTEVALRAAMRVVCDGYQVMVLVPTTVLCFQHFKTFSARFERYGVIVGQLNRFVKGKVEAHTLNLFREGKIDILVGTHRILSQDVKPKRLGLVVVDEEQRFGVAQKEKIKALRAGTDLLTLTATPIPRTLHLSMLGMRDISLITTPPLERQPIKTYIIDFDEDLIAQAIQHEMRRGGQIFFVHNRVEDIKELAAKIQRIVPECKIAIGHGQQDENTLESVIIDFLEHKYHLLLCTTIIESGIDMPNVNTLIINNADHFGLAQLYQLRGRVGRSSRQGYAYLISRNRLAINDEARKRLEVLVTHQTLGAGFQIANYDLELRGAGTLLGGEQSGHVNDVGFELYTQMLEEAIAAERGQERKTDFDPEIKLPVKAKISEKLVPQEVARLQLYKNIFTTERVEDVLELRNETIDRFGTLDDSTESLFKIAMLKLILRDCRVTLIQYKNRGLFEYKFAPLEEKHLSCLYKFKNNAPDGFTVTSDFRILLYLSQINPGKEFLNATDLEPLLQCSEQLRQGMKGLDL